MRSKEQRKFISFCEENGGVLKKCSYRETHRGGRSKWGTNNSSYVFKCLCPFHNEKSPSFYFCKSSLKFYCFGCGAGGLGVEDLQKFQLRRILA